MLFKKLLATETDSFGINPHEARWLTDQVRHSPDLWYLETMEFMHLFCPDDTKHGHSHHCLIEESAFICNAYTQQSYEYWYQEVGKERIPIPMEAHGKVRTVGSLFPPPLKIKGEVHLIRTHQFKDLDNYKRNTVQFRRKRVNLLVPHRVIRTVDHGLVDAEGRELPPILRGKKVYEGAPRVHVIRAWMYVAEPTYWNDLLDAGYRGFKTVNHYESKRPWLKEYYDYRKNS